jgi:CIC family chloride channel protein
MVSEMTGDYKLLLPTMWVSMLCFLLSKRWTIYSKQVGSRLESPAHRGDFIVDILQGIKVRDVLQPERPLFTVPESMPLERIVRLLAETLQRYFPVVDEEGNLKGIFSARDVRSYIYDDTIWRVTIARDIMVTDVLSVSPDDDLNTALRRFTIRNLDELPVLDPRQPGKLLGMVRRRDAIALYNTRLMETKQRLED